MPIKFSCGCGKKLQAPDGSGGGIVECPACGRKISVPAPSAEAEEKISVACSCGKVFRAPADMAGHSVNCPSCGGLLTIPEISYGTASGETYQLDAAPGAADAGTYDVSERRCPNCDAVARADVEFCVECGTNLETGERAEDVEAKKPEDKQKLNWLPVVVALGISGFSLAVGLLIFVAVR